jgi:phosphatidylinositol glycan class B
VNFYRYGHLTWEWINGIRSYAHPALIAGLYKALEYVGLDTVELLTILPRVFQAILTAYADFCFYNWTGKSKWGLFVLLSSWFWFYTGTRTLANTLETSLTMVALSKFPCVLRNCYF